jgi:predicted O-methyltransferase YrrM
VVNNKEHSRLTWRYLTTKAWETSLKLVARPPAELHAVPGYLHPLEGRFLYWLAGKVPAGGIAVEIGSFRGKSSVFLAAGLENAKLFCVDTWLNDAMPYDARYDVMPEFLENTKRFRHRIETLRGTSSVVAASWSRDRSIDLLFIDGDHSYEGCSEDLRAWLVFVRRGGWVAFHDSSQAGVRRAISELFPAARRGYELCAWSMLAATKRD